MQIGPLGREYIYCKTSFIRLFIKRFCFYLYRVVVAVGKKENIELDQRMRWRLRVGKKKSIYCLAFILAGSSRSRFFSRNKPLKPRTDENTISHSLFRNRRVLSKSVFLLCARRVLKKKNMYILFMYKNTQNSAYSNTNEII